MDDSISIPLFVMTDQSRGVLRWTNRNPNIVAVGGVDMNDDGNGHVTRWLTTAWLDYVEAVVWLARDDEKERKGGTTVLQSRL